MCDGLLNQPVRVQAGRALAGSSVTADSCSPASGAPGRRAASPGPGWPGCQSCDPRARGLLRGGSPCCRGFFGGHLECRLLLRCQTCLSFFHRDLGEELDVSQMKVSQQHRLFPTQPDWYSPDVGPLTCPMYPGGGMGGITRLKGIGMFMDVIGLGPAPIIPIWSWVWKYMLDERPAVE